MAARLKEVYISEITPQLMKKFGYKSVMQIPKLDKVIINVAAGEAIANPKVIDAAMSDLAAITGQKPVVIYKLANQERPGMPENGNYMPLPPKFKKQGIEDFVRITDARMSGGCFGTQVLHCAPESAVGGPLAAIRDGDIIHMDVDKNLIEVELSDEELAERLKNVKTNYHPEIERGFLRNFIDNVTQADEGCDLKYMQYKG